MGRKPFEPALVGRLGLVAALALLAGGCAGPAAYHQQAVWRLDGAPIAAGPEAEAQTWQTTAEPDAGQDYEYRGGRDPKTGRASIQM